MEKFSELTFADASFKRSFWSVLSKEDWDKYTSPTRRSKWSSILPENNPRRNSIEKRKENSNYMLHCILLEPLKKKFGLVGFYGISTLVSNLMPNTLYTYISNIWFGLIQFYSISTLVGYLMPNPLYTYILNIYDLVWLGFYGISTTVGYLMPNPLHTYISNIYDLVWLGFMAYQPLWVI